MERHANWKSIAVENTDDSKRFIARLVVVATPGMQHNRLAKITPDVVFVDLGVLKTEGRANVELLGFLAFLLDLDEGQVRIESGESARTKVIVLDKINLDKRELIWLLESKVGQKHEAHFATDNVNRIRCEMNKEAISRRKEKDEFESLRQEAFAAVNHALPSPQVPPPENKSFQTALRVKRKVATGYEEALGEEAMAPKRMASGVHAAVAAQPVVNAVDCPNAAVDGVVVRAAPAGIGGIAAYDSEDESDEDDEEKTPLPPPDL
eukprot:TRINITY_DN74354_c0_g1_i1.p1 TRINITY_DN74354_c0_g1~~TRINITY_DN74354_c0_g1_i1.p1  ORF type:complete len:265 (-),score=69.84 TRINITY_DN74354_c0_g1_i1:108-902(-)